MDEIRKTFLDHDARRNPKTDFSCVMCQKDLDPKRPYRVIGLAVGGSAWVIHPDDMQRYAGEIEQFPIGMDCAKKLGIEWTLLPAT